LVKVIEKKIAELERRQSDIEASSESWFSDPRDSSSNFERRCTRVASLIGDWRETQSFFHEPTDLRGRAIALAPKRIRKTLKAAWQSAGLKVPTRRAHEGLSWGHSWSKAETETEDEDLSVREMIGVGVAEPESGDVAFHDEDGRPVREIPDDTGV
jgi:hypothetical protein